MSSGRKTITPKIKKLIVEKQGNKCANSLYNPALNLSDYKCLLWKYENGYFDDSGYDIDHIDEVSRTKDNGFENLQALCHNCHAVKTRKFKENKTYFTSTELHNGAGIMEVDKPISKKRKIE
jgi:hypothetical protein